MKVDRPGAARVLSHAQIAGFAGVERAAGRRIVFTDGIFDLLHPGHIRYLESARALGDVLIVGISADESVRKSKGPARPVNPDVERAEVVAGLACVDAVVIFGEEARAEIIGLVQPDVLVRRAGSQSGRQAEDDTVEARGGRVVLMPVEGGHSATALIERILHLR